MYQPLLAILQFVMLHAAVPVFLSVIYVYSMARNAMGRGWTTDFSVELTPEQWAGGFNFKDPEPIEFDDEPAAGQSSTD